MYNKDHLKKEDVGFVIQAVYLCVGLMIAFPIVYAFFISFMDPAQVLSGGV